MSRAGFAFVALCTAACAREAAPLRMAPASAFPPASASYEWPPATLGAPPPPAPRPLVAGVGVAAEAPTERTDDRRPRIDAKPGALEPSSGRALEPPPPIDLSVPGKAACLTALDSIGLVYVQLDTKKGVETPIAVSGPIGGIRYDGGTRKEMILDCRLALALARVAPVLKRVGVSAIRYSGAYSYRMSKVGRLSYHAHGLAIDVHELEVEGQWRSVKTDFARGSSEQCSLELPPLNRVACQLKRTGLFKELLTPDYNADHHDHMHWGIAPLPEMPAPSRVGPKTAGSPQ